MDWARRVVATRTFKVLFAVIVVVVVLGAIFGNPDESDEQALTTTTTTTRPPPRVISTTTPTIVVSPTDTKLPPIDHSQTPTTRRRSPIYCRHFLDWQRHEATVAEIERRNPSDNVNDWRPGDVSLWGAALDRRAAAANRMWNAAPAGYTMADVRRAC